jgi:hypothetical protein
MMLDIANARVARGKVYLAGLELVDREPMHPARIKINKLLESDSRATVAARMPSFQVGLAGTGPAAFRRTGSSGLARTVVLGRLNSGTSRLRNHTPKWRQPRLPAV